MALKPRTCKNQCVFCFIDQMPPNLRCSLYVKDDDWRFSLMMGNYITLTNVDEDEFARILKRHASPLYISVHTTDSALRRHMMRNKNAGDLLPRLRRLRDAGIRFHCQIVCCPGINDGDTLMKTLNDLAALTPAALSVAFVPVGITKFRQGLPELTPFDSVSAKMLLKQIEPFQKRCLKRLGTSFAFASDELYCLSEEELPPAAWYEGYPQIENGVGLLRQFEEQLREAAKDDEETPPKAPRTYIVVTGNIAAPYMRQFCEAYAPQNITVKVETITNRFFGETVTVSGLLTGGDVLVQLSPTSLEDADTLFISANMLRHDRELFLDGMTFKDFQSRLPLPVRVVDDGYDLYNALRNR
jgi:putative radical SAM enzyme (TIGR03279 family)